MRMGLFLPLLVGFLPAVGSEPTAALNNKTFATWRDRIRPQEKERGFETVKWLPTFWGAVIAAQKADKPILLYAMNGHPLACT